MYRISKFYWKLPVFIHNLKGYDGHLIVKALKSEFSKVQVIPQNMEKYLSLTVGQLKFITSFQFTLSDDEFRYLRESCTSDTKVSIPMTIWIALTVLKRQPS